MPKPADLTLYHYPSCPFCRRVFMALQDLGVEIAQRNIYGDEGALQELMAARGRATVPVLRIIQPDGTERWMPESRDIVEFLYEELA